jgi:Pyridine nucleotide-disulphide oxidoreductase
VVDAIALRNHLLRSLESAAVRLDPAEAERDLGFVFVGAGYAGVEALAELGDLAREAVRRSYPTLRDVRQRWVLVDAASRILADIPPKLGEYTHRYLEREGIEIHAETTLVSFDEREARALRRHAHSGADARLGRGGTSESRPRAARPAARRAGARDGRPDAAGHGHDGRTIRRKIRVVADWTAALFFRRDIVELSALSRPHELGPRSG